EIYNDYIRFASLEPNKNNSVYVGEKTSQRIEIALTLTNTGLNGYTMDVRDNAD
ncbi:hypothetical protein CHS0354_029206, partial [Potamilus streckersoni]